MRTLWMLIKNEYYYWIAQQFRKLHTSYHYDFVDEYLRKQVDAGHAEHFHNLIDSQAKVW